MIRLTELRMETLNKILYTTLSVLIAILFAIIIIGIISFLLTILWPFVFIGLAVITYFSIKEIFNSNKIF
jgi:hypothetical protein